MKYSFHPLAKIELNESVDYYEKCQAGLGIGFAKDIYSVVCRIIQFPKAWPKLSKNTRKCLANRFPYGVIYQTLDNEILSSCYNLDLGFTWSF